MTRSHFRFALCLTSLLLLGCGGSSKGPVGGISGVVTQDGKPVPAGEVSFFSAELAIGAMATINPDGSYELTEELPPGEYAVAIVSPPEVPGGPAAPPFNVPAKYRQAKTSGLTCTVAAGENTYNIELAGS